MLSAMQSWKRQVLKREHEDRLIAKLRLMLIAKLRLMIQRHRQLAKSKQDPDLLATYEQMIKQLQRQVRTRPKPR